MVLLEEHETKNPFYVQIDYENQNLDDLDANPYEVVVAISKVARDINRKIQKTAGPNASFFPLNLAYKKLDNENITFDHEAEEKDSTNHDQ
jgi:hypothetical protein